MKCKITKLENFSGRKASLYSVYVEEKNKTLFEEFLEENRNLLINEIKDILIRLKTIGEKTGVKEEFFKLREGTLGDGICALYDIPNKKLRLYCIRYGSDIIIIGGGGVKPKNIKALQENEKLTKENYLLRKISKEITTKIINGELKYSSDGLDFIGELNFEIE